MSENDAMGTPAQNDRQISKFPGQTTYVTGHDENGKSVVKQTRSGNWTQFDDKQLAYNNIYSTKFPADLNEDGDLAAHEESAKSGNVGKVAKDSVATYQVDFAPGYKTEARRNVSLDFAVVLEGSIEMILDDGRTTLLRRGDVAIQRAASHAWRNPSKEEYARVQFVMQDIQPLTVAGKDLKNESG